ncbi:hypothetical protein NEK97_19550 [Paenarthrobacter sp. UW852]|uniref:hypothetical protein n=1 Tax=Paenarthrobacter sp. UW852 TaxID=2951989 RepID=UPI0021475966|nr:hypothetical protein [Paenarthrobacter sp. UW852]MCR1163666.1 hypothetical protein [Paenarthrobacter sp. UW852]
MALSDPALYSSSQVRAAWFMSDSEDVIDAMAVYVKKILDKLGLKNEDVVIYGSSMGGFGALMLGAELAGSFAVAEVPQLDMRKYPIRGAIRALERHVINQDLEEFYKQHPERVNVLDRFQERRVLPKLKIVTNRADTGFQEQMHFLNELSTLKTEVESIYDTEIHIVSEEIGHKPLPTSRGIEIVRSALSQTVKEAQKTDFAAEPIQDRRSYQELVDSAVASIGQIKFIRDAEETTLYLSAKNDLYAAARLNASADWPYRRLCSLIKLWTNSFNQEILDCALAGMARKETLESFIYVCRGLLFNNKPAQAAELIDSLIETTSDPDIANVGRIFQSLCAYESGDFNRYCELIEGFRSNKSSGFEPYIAIPVSTVVTSTPDSLSPSPSPVRLLGLELTEVPKLSPGTKYVVSASCDEVYFRKYAEYLVKSFSATCGSEATMFLSVITDNSVEIQKLLDQWGARSIILNPLRMRVSENIGPVASLVRFSTVYPILSALNVPVVVLDLDTVITGPLSSLIEAHAQTDVCSRILGGGVAPWEKYTGGFAIFNTTESSKAVAGFMASAAESMAHEGSKQWWIDQNCFEAGIRMVQQSGRRLTIDNVMSERDKFCVMPVGTGDAKIHSLESALKGLLEVEGAARV